MSCGNSNEEKVIPNFKESELSFLHLRFGYEKTDNWIKNPENIMMIHETFKKIGYENLITKEEWIESGIWWLDVWKSPNNLIDSLELTYGNYKESPKYYREFWERRINEGNDKSVYKVVNEIKRLLIDDENIETKYESVNDTLYKLMSYEYPERKLSNEESNELLNYLIDIGLHESAYNLASGETGKFKDAKWEKTYKSVLKLLKKSDTNQRPWFQDDTK